MTDTSQVPEIVRDVDGLKFDLNRLEDDLQTVLRDVGHNIQDLRADAIRLTSLDDQMLTVQNAIVRLDVGYRDLRTLICDFAERLAKVEAYTHDHSCP